MGLKILVVAAAGGLGSTVVREALSRGHEVSVLVRSAEKLAAALGTDVSRLSKVSIGDGADLAVSTSAIANVDAVARQSL